MIFSFQIWWIAPYYAGLLIGSGKKSKFAGFLGANSRKNRPILRHFRGNVWAKLRRKSIGKKGRFCGYFWGKILLDVDRLCADQTSVFNVFLTEVIICSFNNNTLQKWTNGKANTAAKRLRMRLVEHFRSLFQSHFPVRKKSSARSRIHSVCIL